MPRSRVPGRVPRVLSSALLIFGVWGLSGSFASKEACGGGKTAGGDQSQLPRLIHRLELDELFAGELACSADGRLFACLEKKSATAADNDYAAVRVYDIASGKLVARLPVPADEHNPHRVVFSPDGSKLAVAVSNRSLRVWDLKTAKALIVVPRKGGERWRDQPYTFSPDGRFLIGISDGAYPNPDTIRIWDLRSSKELRSIGFRDGWVEEFFLSGDSKTLVTEHLRRVAGDENSDEFVLRATVHLWEVETARHLGQFGARVDLHAQFTNERKTPVFRGRSYWKGDMLRKVGAVAHGLQIRVAPVGWKVVLPTFQDDPVLELRPAQRQIPARLIDATSGRELQRLPAPGEFRPFCLSVDHGFLASIEGSQPRQGLYVLCVRDISPWRDQALRELPLYTDLAAEAQWELLADADPLKAYWAMRRLAASPDPTLGLVRARLRPALDKAKHVPQLIERLDNPEFDTRRDAQDQLARIGEQAGPAMKKALQGNIPVETRRRLEALLAALSEGDKPDAETRRSIRALAILEHIGTNAAREHLQTLAGGAPGAWLTQEARASLERLAAKHKAHR